MGNRPTIAVAPKGEYSYLTSGKEYEIKQWISDVLFIIESEHEKVGNIVCSSFSGCAHLRGKDWILK